MRKTEKGRRTIKKREEEGRDRQGKREGEKKKKLVEEGLWKGRIGNGLDFMALNFYASREGLQFKTPFHLPRHEI